MVTFLLMIGTFALLILVTLLIMATFYIAAYLLAEAFS